MDEVEIPSDGLRRALRDLKDAQDAVIEAQGRLFYLQQRRDQAKRVVQEMRDARASLLLSREQLRVRGDLPTGVLLPVGAVLP